MPIATALFPHMWGDDVLDVYAALGCYESIAAKIAHVMKPAGFNIGVEHPAWAATAIQMAIKKGAKSILEVGYQCGGLTIPMAMYCGPRRIEYVAIDSYGSEESGPDQDEIIRSSIVNLGGRREWVDLIGGKLYEPGDFAGRQFDLAIFDHDKPLTAVHIYESLRARATAQNAWFLVHDATLYADVLGEALADEVKAAKIGIYHHLKYGPFDVKCEDVAMVEAAWRGE